MPLGFSSLGRSLEEVHRFRPSWPCSLALAAILVTQRPTGCLTGWSWTLALPCLHRPSPTEVPRDYCGDMRGDGWLQACWPAFAVSILLSPKPKKGKDFISEASFDVPAPALQLEALVRSSANSGTSLHHAAETPADPAVSRIKAVVRRAAHSAEMTAAPGPVAVKPRPIGNRH